MSAKGAKIKRRRLFPCILCIWYFCKKDKNQNEGNKGAQYNANKALVEILRHFALYCKTAFANILPEYGDYRYS